MTRPVISGRVGGARGQEPAPLPLGHRVASVTAASSRTTVTGQKAPVTQ
jgi:hypothetical protein